MYLTEYHHKLTTPEKAVAALRDGDTIVHAMAVGEPPALLAAIADRVRQGHLKDLKVYSLLPMGHAERTILAVELSGQIHHYSWFVTAADRELVKAGLNFFVPNEFHQIPRLCRDFMDVDAALPTVSPMDNAGFFTFGAVNDYISTAARCGRRLLVEVNPRMPRVFGESLLHVSEVDRKSVV